MIFHNHSKKIQKGLEPWSVVPIVRTPIDSGGGNKPEVDVLFEVQFKFLRPSE